MLILGTNVHNITLSQALKKAEGFLSDGKQHYIVTPNPEIILLAKRDIDYRRILKGAHLSIPDGKGLLLASRFIYGKNKAIKERVTGSDFMIKFLGTLDSRKILLLGGRQGVAEAAAANLKRRFPACEFYSLSNYENKYIDFLINDLFRPDCIFVGLGAPKQEKWIRENLSRYPTVKIAMGVGGSLDFIAGRVSRAPFFLREGGFEWLWRVAVEPWRARRIFNATVVFPVLVLKEKIKVFKP